MVEAELFTYIQTLRGASSSASAKLVGIATTGHGTIIVKCRDYFIATITSISVSR